MTDKQPWDVFMLSQDRRDRFDLLPAELRTAINSVIDAACDLYDDTFSDPLSATDAGEKVQAEHSSPGGRRVNKGRSRQARFLRSGLPARLERMSGEMRAWMAGVERPRTGPRFRSKSA